MSASVRRRAGLAGHRAAAGAEPAAAVRLAEVHRGARNAELPERAGAAQLHRHPPRRRRLRRLAPVLRARREAAPSGQDPRQPHDQRWRDRSQLGTRRAWHPDACRMGHPKHLGSGRLVPVLPQYQTPEANIYAVYAHRHQLSVRVRSFVDYLTQAFSKFDVAVR